MKVQSEGHNSISLLSVFPKAKSKKTRWMWLQQFRQEIMFKGTWVAAVEMVSNGKMLEITFQESHRAAYMWGSWEKEHQGGL